mmetsp:Transcript_134455/g.429525  ORF Transcript_134455/g.429525 Transcript_134455/m.429525 type:complete len:214 (+) Transcript_134455:570-1211(+)
MSLKWSMPLSPSGRRPSWDSTDSAEEAASLRPKRVLMLGPPMTRMATLAANCQRSALEMRAGTYLSVMGFKRPRATSGRPALAPKEPSPPSVKRIAALGQPPLSAPFEKTPASCQARRMMRAPQFLVFMTVSRSEASVSKERSPPRAAMAMQPRWCRGLGALRRAFKAAAASAATPSTDEAPMPPIWAAGLSAPTPTCACVCTPGRATSEEKV